MDVYLFLFKHQLNKLMVDEPMHPPQKSQLKEKSNCLSVSLSAMTLLTIKNDVSPRKSPAHWRFMYLQNIQG